VILPQRANPAKGQQEPVWQVPDDAVLLYRRWDEECVVYDDRAGSTHLLSTLAAELLEYLAIAPAQASQATAYVARVLGCSPTDEIGQAVTRALFELEHLGLLERAQD
jgi:PqqD family protein of HPr-rel-A system